MSWTSWLPGRRPVLDAVQVSRLDRHRARSEPGYDRPAVRSRIVVADVESSGLDPARDRLISIGAIAVDGGLVRLDQTFRVVLRQKTVSPGENILVHGIGGTAQRAGMAPADALLDFLEFARKDPVAGFHTDFDRMLIDREAQSALGTRPRQRWLDLASIAPALFPEHGARAHALDDWLRIFGIENVMRHDAVADALATAQLLLVVLQRAKACGCESVADLMRVEKDQRWLARH